MTSMLNPEPARRDEIVADAVERRTPLVLTYQRGTAWTTLKASFLAGSTPGQHIAITVAHSESGRQAPRLEPGQRVGVSFRRGHKKCLFATTVEPAAPAPSSDTSADGHVMLRWPETLQEMQRRVYHRAAPPPGREIAVRVALGHHVRPSDCCACDYARSEESRIALAFPFDARLEDLSVGGIRVLSPTDPKLPIGAAVVCTFVSSTARSRCTSRADSEFALNAVFRHAEPRGSAHSLGFQFVGVETRDDGPAVLSRLAKLVTDFQRATARHPCRPSR